MLALIDAYDVPACLIWRSRGVDFDSGPGPCIDCRPRPTRREVLARHLRRVLWWRHG